MDGQETLSEQKNQTKKKLNTWDNQNVRIELTFTNIWSSSNCFIDKHNLIEKWMNATYLKIVKLIKTGLTKANFFSPEDIIEKKNPLPGSTFLKFSMLDL